MEETEEFPYCHQCVDSDGSEILCKCKCFTVFCEEDPLQSLISLRDEDEIEPR